MKELRVYEEWETESDELQFEHAGLRCLVLRAELGHLCGYVGAEHLPQNFDEYEVDVHGGVTFSQPLESCSERLSEFFEGCEHVFGFDAAHAGDLIPTMQQVGGEYRNILYMREEAVKLAEQLSYKRLE